MNTRRVSGGMRRDRTLKTRGSTFRCRCGRGEPSPGADAGGGVYSHHYHRLRQRGDDHHLCWRGLRLNGGCHRMLQAHPPVHGPVGSLEMSPPPGRSEREGSSAGPWIRKREDARAAGVRASCVTVSVEQRCDTHSVAEAATGLAPYLLSRLLSAGSLARAAPPNSCAHSDSMAARSRLVAFERGPQCRMNRESLAAIQPLQSPMPTFRVGLAEG